MNKSHKKRLAKFREQQTLANKEKELMENLIANMTMGSNGCNTSYQSEQENLNIIDVLEFYPTSVQTDMFVELAGKQSLSSMMYATGNMDNNTLNRLKICVQAQINRRNNAGIMK